MDNITNASKLHLHYITQTIDRVNLDNYIRSRFQKYRTTYQLHNDTQYDVEYRLEISPFLINNFVKMGVNNKFSLTRSNGDNRSVDNFVSLFSFRR